MTAEAMLEALQRDRRCTSQPLATRWFDHLPGGRTCHFYAGVVRENVLAGRRAARGDLPDDALATYCMRVLESAVRVGADVAIDGIEHVCSVDGPCVIVGNHMGTLETCVLPGILLPFRPVTFVVKRSLLGYPYLGAVLCQLQAIGVDRKSARGDLVQVLKEGEQRLKAGLSVIVFPQSTRSAVFDPEGFNTLGVKLARRAKVPVVPMALRTDFWGNGPWIKDIGPIRPALPIRFAFDAPIPVEGRGDAAHDRVVAFILDRLAAWGAAPPKA